MPLWLALMYGRKAVVELLLANDYIGQRFKDSRQWTTLWLAAEYVWVKGGSEAMSVGQLTNVCVA